MECIKPAMCRAWLKSAPPAGSPRSQATCLTLASLLLACSRTSGKKTSSIAGPRPPSRWIHDSRPASGSRTSAALMAAIRAKGEMPRSCCCRLEPFAARDSRYQPWGTSMVADPVVRPMPVATIAVAWAGAGAGRRQHCHSSIAAPMVHSRWSIMPWSPTCARQTRNELNHERRAMESP